MTSNIQVILINMNDLTLVIPAKNEAESLPKVLEELKNLITIFLLFYTKLIIKQLNQERIIT